MDEHQEKPNKKELFHWSCKTPMNVLGTNLAWCPACGALYVEGQMLDPAAMTQLATLCADITGEPVGKFPDGGLVPEMLHVVRDRLDAEHTSNIVTLRYYAELHAEVVELRKRRDELLAHNNELVEARRRAEHRADFAEARRDGSSGV